MVKTQRNVGRPAMTQEQRDAKEKEIDTHIKLPESVVNAIDTERREKESRKDCIIRLLNERLGR